MNLFKHLIPASKITPKIPSSTLDTKLVLSEISPLIKTFIESTARKSIRLQVPRYQLKVDPANRILDTKIGGFPYWPKSMKYPTSKQGNPLFLAAQLNFARLPRLEGYPTSGLLQFFVDFNDSMLGSGSDDAYAVIYHRNPNEKLALPQSSIPVSTFNAPDGPIQGVCYPAPHIETSYVNESNCALDQLLPIVNEHLNTNYRWYGSLPNYIIDEVQKIFGELGATQAGGCRIGGWPWSPQDDLLSDHYSVLLLQLDSEGEMMWGDCGTCNFLISQKDLKALKFNDVYYDWSCY